MLDTRCNLTVGMFHKIAIPTKCLVLFTRARETIKSLSVSHFDGPGSLVFPGLFGCSINTRGRVALNRATHCVGQSTRPGLSNKNKLYIRSKRECFCCCFSLFLCFITDCRRVWSFGCAQTHAQPNGRDFSILNIYYTVLARGALIILQ